MENNTQKIIIVIVVLLILIIGSVYFFRNDSPSPAQTDPTPTTTNSSTGTPTTTSSSDVIVLIGGGGFNPVNVTVKEGTRVTWINNDDVVHTITSESGNLLNSPNLSPGQSFSFVFSSASVNTYRSTLYPTVRGTITVVK